MTEFVQMPPLESTKELKEWIIESLHKRMFKLILYNPDDYKDDRDPKIKAIINGQEFPIQTDTCQIVRNIHAIALAFDARMILKRCISKKKINSLNSNKQHIDDICQKIEDVLGNVSVVNELRKAIVDYQKSISDVFNFNKEE